MSPTIVLWGALVAAVPPSSAATPPGQASQVQQTRRTARVMLGVLPLSFAAFAGVHAFGFGLRQDWIACKTPRNRHAAAAFRAVLCIGVPGKVELIAGGAPMTLATLASHDLTSLRLQDGRTRWRRPSALAAVVGGSVVIAGGFATVVVSLAAEPAVFRNKDGWGWPYWTHVVVAQSGAALMAAGGALVGTGAAHLEPQRAQRQTRIRIAPAWGPGLVVFGRL